MAGQHHWAYVVEEQGHHSLPCVLSEIAAGIVTAHGSASAPSLLSSYQIAEFPRDICRDQNTWEAHVEDQSVITSRNRSTEPLCCAGECLPSLLQESESQNF